MELCMALSEQLRLRKQPAKAPSGVYTEAIDRQVRIEHLRQLVAHGTYKVSPQRLALKILVKALVRAS
jgi:anti-sigma28 factor (negative regulator of flagellin synthesis)